MKLLIFERCVQAFMDRFVNQISRPKFVILTVFAIVSFVNLAAFVWLFSFDWLFGAGPLVVVLLILIFVGLVVSILVDKKSGSRLKGYFIIALVELLFIWWISNPIRTWQINTSFTKAKDIIEPLIKFKTQVGTYPTTLTELEERLKLDIPRWTNIGTEYKYERDGNENYRLGFRSYRGYSAHYNKDKHEWIVVD